MKYEAALPSHYTQVTFFLVAWCLRKQSHPFAHIYARRGRVTHSGAEIYSFLCSSYEAFAFYVRIRRFSICIHYCSHIGILCRRIRRETMHIESSEHLRPWLVKELTPMFVHRSVQTRQCFLCRSDADPVPLARYVMALLKKEMDTPQLKAFCEEQLDVFLGKCTL